MGTTELIRELGGVELPAPGPWAIPRSHLSVHFSARTGRLRRARGQTPAATGTLCVEEDGRVSLLLSVGAWARPGGGAAASLGTLLGNPRINGIVLRAETAGPASGRTWPMQGEVGLSWVTRPASVVVTYHGVFRAGPDAKAWLTLWASIDDDFAGRRQRGPVDLVADVLALAPSGTIDRDADRLVRVA
jgi:hypothetical protein